MTDHTLSTLFFLGVVAAAICALLDEPSFIFRQRIPGFLFTAGALAAAIALAWRNF